MKLTFISLIRRSPITKLICLTVIVSLLFELGFPTIALALTSGPVQQEYISFEPAGTTDMVNTYTGDFTYNIPLLSVPGPNGGYPINLAYHSGVTMEQEASWVGLGWNINVGAINRQLRGLPDDFNGDEVNYKMDMKRSETTTYSYGLDVYGEAMGVSTISTGIGVGASFNGEIYYNNYKGIGYRISQGLNMGTAMASAGLNLSYDSQTGLGIQPSYSVGAFHASANVSARDGLQSMSMGVNTVWGIDLGHEFPFTQTPAPQVGIPTQSNIYTGHLAGSVTVPLWGIWTSFGTFSFANYTTTSVKNKEFSKAAYGYLNSHETNNLDAEDYILDFDREPYEYSKKLPNLPTSQVSYDFFGVTGQGIGGAFRAHRSEVGIYHSNLNVSEIKGHAAGLQGALQATRAHIGIDYTNDKGFNRSGPWMQAGDIESVLTFEDISPTETTKPNGSPLYEPYYFQMNGETNVQLLDEDHLSLWNGEEAIRMDIAVDETGPNREWEFTSSKKFITNAGSSSSVFNGDGNVGEDEHFISSRQRRGTDIEYFTDKQVQEYGYGNKVSYFDADGNLTVKQSASTQGSVIQDHHLSDISILQSDGMRYNYSLPIYNKATTDALFSVNENAADYNDSYVSVPESGGEIDVSGTYNEFLSVTDMPAYASTWLLTSVVSDDYVDLENDGPTDDDYGYWVKFNYKKTSDDYNWRFPYEDAIFIEGNKHDPTDNRAAYSAGTKELYYLESVETKTHIAIFEKTKREDAIAAKDEISGGMPTTVTDEDRMWKLDKIKLYNKAYYNVEEGSENVTPLRTVEFTYDYYLCGDANVPNNTLQTDETATANQGGKLTLKEVEFTFNTSTKGRLSPYKFTYSTNNPDYNRLDIDRWGNYKANSETYMNQYPFVDFPYTEQSSAPAADAWSLVKIELPTGGEMNIEYESDDYAYVEDKRATRMFDIIGLGTADGTAARSNSSPNYADLTAHTTTSGADDDHYRIYFQLDEPLTETDAAVRSTYVLENIIGDLEYMYFKTYTCLLDDQNNANKDYVSGYVKLVTTGHGSGSKDFYGIDEGNTTGEYDHAYVTVEKTSISPTIDNVQSSILPAVAGNAHPFRIAAFQHLKANRPELYSMSVPYATTPAAQILNLIGSVAQFVGDLQMILLGFNQWCINEEYAEEIELNGKSVVKLQEPTGKKYGGGTRVKRITIDDKWKNPNTTDDHYVYGQEYKYLINEGGNVLSSGVAYEPMVGKEESALSEPVPYPLSVPLSSTYKLFIEKPVMHKYYPSPMVGYRRVEVRSIAPEKAEADDSNNELSYTRRPVNILEFYTPKEFPILVDETDYNKDPYIFKTLTTPVISWFRKKLIRSQGYSITLNDMSGRLRSITQLAINNAESDEPVNETIGSIISKQEYIYHTKNTFNDNGKNELSSKVQVLTENGEYQTAIVGQTHDIHVDMHEDRMEKSTRGLHMNFEIEGAAVFFPVIPVPLFQKRTEETSLKLVTTTKVIQKRGILKKVITQDYQSVVTTESLAYDLETGDALLTKVTNEFKDPIYSYGYPAHWYYDAMGRASGNWNAVFDNGDYTISSNGTLPVSGLPGGTSLSDYFIEGDQLFLDYSSGGVDGLYRVVDVGTNLVCVGTDGEYAPNGTIDVIRIVKSGRKNTLYDPAGNLTAKVQTGFTAYDPGDPTNTEFEASDNKTVSFSEVLNASALEYSDEWSTYCCPDNNPRDPENQNYTDRVSEFDLGMRGNWRPYKSYSYLGSRDYSDGKTREDGHYTSFTEFDWTPGTNTNWFADNEITKYSPDGYELESKDGIGRYSAAIYGFDRAVVEAVASNAKYREIAFESFEDQGYLTEACVDCPEKNHWGYVTSTSIKPTLKKSHSGLRSLYLDAGETWSVESYLKGTNCDSYAKSYNPLVNIDTCDCLGSFKPTPGDTFVFDAWVHQNGGIKTDLTNFSNAQVNIKFYDGGASLISTTTITVNVLDPIIDGWQKLYGEFQIPTNTAKMVVELENSSLTPNGYVMYDDLRILPFNARMTSYVYDILKLRLVAELDENNHATFYNYDENGQLIKVTKETETGIKTVSESRSGNVHD